MGLITRALAHKAVGAAAKKKGLNLHLGFALARDRRVSFGFKATALAIGLGLTALLIAIEFPLEAIVGALLPAVGLVADIAIDGLEIVALPLILGALALPFLVPKGLAERLNLA